MENKEYLDHLLGLPGNDIVSIMMDTGVELKKQGKEWLGRCPLHEDKTPSLSVNREKGMYKCFGCGASGNVFTYLKEVRITSTPVRWLEDRAGLKPNGGASSAPPLKGLRGSLERGSSEKGPNGLPERIELLNPVTDHYHRTLPNNGTALAYLQARGIDEPQLVENLKLGYADGSLARSVKGNRELQQELQSIGVLNKRYTEPFYGCLVVPILDEAGGCVELYGRRISNPRSRIQHLYLSGPHAGVFNPTAYREHPQLLLTEALLDALTLIVHGFPNVSATYGTQGFTPHHLEAFKRGKVRRVYLAFDADPAGDAGARAVAEKLAPLGIPCHRVELPEKTDVNEYFTGDNGTRESFQALLSKAQPMLEVAVPVETSVSSIPSEPPLAEAASPPLLEVSDEEVVARYGERSYRVRGLSSGSHTRMRVNVKLSQGERSHLDTLDLMISRQRAGFANRAAEALETEPGPIRSDLDRLVEDLERVRETRRAQEEARRAPADQVPGLTDKERQEALELLRTQDLLSMIDQDLEAMGIAGEQINRRMLYMAFTSRKLARPLSVAVKGDSSGGKSYLMQNVLRLMPPEDVKNFTEISPKALFYMDETALVHKILVVFEHKGGEAADYSIRTLQSEQRLVIAVPIKDPQTNQFRTMEKHVRGPVCYAQSSCALGGHPENATRMYDLYIDESDEQTRRIYRVQDLQYVPQLRPDNAQLMALVRKHHHLQRVLEPRKVLIDYAPLISFPTSELRLRRDRARFLALIECFTLLHQYQRDTRTVKSAEYVVATLDDYKMAYDLACHVLADTLSALHAHARTLWQHLREIAAERGDDPRGVSLTDLEKATGWTPRKIRRYLEQLLTEEYIELRSGGQGKRCFYAPVPGKEARRDELAGIPSPEELERKMRKRS